MKENKIILIFIIILATFSFILPVYAKEEYVILLGEVNIRTGPSTNYDVIKVGQIGTTYNLKSTKIVADKAKDGTCDEGWYNIDADGKNGYVCSAFVSAHIEVTENSVATTACEAEMKQAGFPQSYWNKLCSLKTKYPKWTFKAVKTNVDFKSAVNKFTSCGDSLIANPKKEWIDKSCSYAEGPFVTVNQTGVAFYLDPRNFLTEEYIFQFEDNHYNPKLESKYSAIAKYIIEDTAFYAYHTKLKNDLASFIAQGGKETNVNPAHLASRMYQELGTSDRLENLYIGTYNKVVNGERWDFRNLYNFYNIGVTGYCVTVGKGATYCGLTKAREMGWNTVYKAVKGGGDFLNSGYINVGQYTSYLERFNVVPTNPAHMYIMYYMANLQSPSTESLTVYNAYKANKVLSDAFIFYIPVYNNMDNEINNSSSGATNDASSSAPSTSSFGSIITSAGYRSSSDNILGIASDTKASTVKQKLEAIAGANNVTITNKDGKEITKDLIGTGSKVTIKNKEGTHTFTVIIKGDTSGDGKINALDLLQVQKNILGTSTLKNEFKTAADTSGDGKINALDLLQVQKNILGMSKIKQ